MSEARSDRLEARLGHIEETVARIDERLAATLPHLATKAKLADLRTELIKEIGKKPGHAYLWGVMAVLVGAQAVALAAAALVFSFIAARPPAAAAPPPAQHAELPLAR